MGSEPSPPSENPAQTLFLNLAETLAGPTTPAKLRRALATCRRQLNAMQLSLFELYPEPSEMVRLASACEQDEQVLVDQAGQPIPRAIRELLAEGQTARGVKSPDLHFALFGRHPSPEPPDHQSMLLILVPLPSQRQGLMALAGNALADYHSGDLRELGELVFAAANHYSGNHNRLSRSSTLFKAINLSDSIYASWEENDGWQYHNMNALVPLGYRKENLTLGAPVRNNPMHPEDWEYARRLFRETQRGGTGYEHDYRAVGLHGESQWYHAEVTVTEKNSTGGARKLLSISRNISEIQAAARAAVEKANLDKWLVGQAKAIFSCTNFERMNTVLREIGHYLELDRCILHVVDPATLYCNLVAEWQAPELEPVAKMYPELAWHTGTGWVDQLVADGETYVVNDSSTIPRNNIVDDAADLPDQTTARYFRAIGMRANLAQLMINESRLTGCLSLFSRHSRQWNVTQVRIAKELADAVHLAIMRNRLLDELRATDERYQLAMEHSTYGLWDEDKRNGTMYYSPHFYEGLGYPPKDHPIPLLSILDYIHPDDHKLLYEQLQMEAGSDSINLELRHVRKDGSYIWLLSRGKVVERDPRGKPLRLIGVNMDITEHKQTLAELREAQELAEEANQAKSEFLERMSHEIRTPMNAILGMAYLSLQTNLNEHQKSCLQDIHGAAESLLHIIDDILDFSRIEAGELKIVDERFNLEAEVQRFIKLVSLRAVQAGNNLSYEIDKDVPGILVGDRHRLGQVLTNLLTNAVKFTTEGTVTLAVSRIDHSRPDQAVTLCFTVRDSGIGMNEEQIATLFKPFVQADGATSRKYGGTGLGLSICKHLVEMMGGSIHCTSTPNVGTTFEFTIVFRQADAGALRDQRAQPIPLPDQLKPSAPTTQQSRKRKVLLAEDNLVNQKVATGILAKFDIEVVTATNGAEAITILERSGENQLDAILMDIEMPVLDGLAATRAIRSQRRFRSIPIIAMTAHAMSGDRERCMEAGMQDYVPKPINPHNLVQALDRLWATTAK